jgi:hypothetical protein
LILRNEEENSNKKGIIMTKYKTNEEIEALVTAFESATISRDDWKHAEHMIVALYYLERHDFDTASTKMRDGIFNLLRNGFGLDLTKEMPYHETMTIFWMRTVAAFNASKNGTPAVEKVREMVERFDKDYPLKFYSRELLFSDAARATFVEADLVST